MEEPRTRIILIAKFLVNGNHSIVPVRIANYTNDREVSIGTSETKVEENSVQDSQPEILEDLIGKFKKTWNNLTQEHLFKVSTFVQEHSGISANGIITV